VTQRIFPVRYEWGRLLGLAGSAAALWAGGRLLPEAPWAVAVRVGLWLLWPALLWAGGAVSAEEKRHVGSLLRTFFAPARAPAQDEDAPAAAAA
jgi:hypothetical protein